MFTYSSLSRHLVRKGFRSWQATILLDEIYKTIIRLKGEGAFTSVRLAVRTISTHVLCTSDLETNGEYEPFLGAVLIRPSNNEDELRERMAHELWHLYGSRHQYANAFSGLRLLEEGLTGERADIRYIYEEPVLTVDDYEWYLESFAREENPGPDPDPEEPLWFYPFGDDMGQLLYLMTDGDFAAAYQVLRHLNHGQSLADAFKNTR